MRVVRLKPILAVLMLAIFALASSHSLLESLGLIHHHEATHSEHHDNSESDHRLADGELSINFSRNGIQKSVADSSFDLAKIVALACVLLQHDALLSQSPVQIASSPPLELGKSWQFFSRAALPIRAPSFAS